MTQIKIIKNILDSNMCTFENRMNVAIKELTDNGCKIQKINAQYVSFGNGYDSVIVGIGTILYDDEINFETDFAGSGEKEPCEIQEQ